MSGLVKAKKYEWKDSNLALFGSDTEKAVKKESAESEPAWEGIGQEVGLKIFRIVKFKVEAWPEEDYGKFYNGDSYIVLNTFKPDPESEELDYDVHFWIGSKSSQDEYGTAAYKTVELDTFLDDKATQHREVQGFESDLFKSYFSSITTLEGGADTGFRHVEPESYEPRLLHFHGQKRSVTVRQVPRARSRIDSADVFILDLGLHLYTWIGSRCSKDEKFKAAQYIMQLKSERGGKPEVTTLEENDISDQHPFYEKLDEEDDEDVGKDATDGHTAKKLFRVHEGDGKTNCEAVKDEAEMGDLDSSDVFILDTNAHTFVWIGKGASEAEKKNGLGYAHKHLMGTDHPFAPVTVLNEGHENKEFQTAMAA